MLEAGFAALLRGSTEIQGSAIRALIALGCVRKALIALGCVRKL